MLKKIIRITWNAGFGWPLDAADLAGLALEGIDASLAVGVLIDTEGMDDEAVLERLFMETNTYRGAWWDVINARIGRGGGVERRHHTALSVGDTVHISGREYRCDRFGWTRINKIETKEMI